MQQDFVFATYVLELKKALRRNKANETVISALYGLVALPAKLDNKNGETIDCAKTTGNDIVHRRTNPHQDIQAHSHDAIVITNIATNFKSRFKNDLHPAKIPTLIDSLVDLIRESNINENTKSELCSLANADDPWDFLGMTYLESLLPVNKLDLNLAKTNKSQISPEYPKRPEASIPEDISHSEGRFIGELMRVYEEQEQHEGFDLEDLDDHPESKKHFQRQRSNFYAAEAVRRGTRDIFTESEENQFDVLEDEIYHGIDDLYLSGFNSGMERLTSVVTLAGTIPIQRSWLGRHTDWISPAEKKGVCHFLVNDGFLPGWVESDE